MKTLTVFDHVTVDGYFAGPRGEIDWFKAIQKDEEYDAYTHQAATPGNTLILGRTTYDMMESYWPTPEAIANDPAMAKVMDESPKLVFSRKLRSVEEGPHWKNITVLHEIRRADIIQRKEQAKADLTILGSGSIVQQFARLGLIDEYHLVVVPIVLGAGKQLFTDVVRTNLKLLGTRAFKNGLTLSRYKPA